MSLKKVNVQTFHYGVLALAVFVLTIVIFYPEHTAKGQVEGASTVNTQYVTQTHESFSQRIGAFIVGLFGQHSMTNSSQSPDTSTNITPSATTSTSLPLGDNKAVYTSPKSGYIYLCHQMSDPNGGGTSQVGPWISGTTWDPNKKVHVAGSVSWPSANAKFTLSGSSRVITTNDLPTDHTTGVFPIASSDPAHAYDQNPNSIKTQSISVTLPTNPTVSSTANCMGGEVGIALTGVAIFNGFDAQLRDAVANEVQDSYGGHPQMSGEYHYHTIPKIIQTLLPSSHGTTLVGYAYDGFGIYANIENGKKITNADLDECHGHTSPIMWDGKLVNMYHYTVTDEFPYTVGCFRGKPVTTMPTGGTQSVQSQAKQSQEVSNTQQGSQRPPPPRQSPPPMPSGNQRPFSPAH